MLGVFAFLLIFLFTSLDANACRIRRQELDNTNFYLLNSPVMNSLSDKGVYAGIANVQFIEAGKPFSHIPNAFDVPVLLRQANIKFSFEKMLFGKQPNTLFLNDKSCDFSDVTGEETCGFTRAIVPHAEDSERLNIDNYNKLKTNFKQKRHDERAAFDFYDRMPLGIPQMEEVLKDDLIIISCGPQTIDMVQAGLTYLVIGNGQEILSIEPLSGPKDPLIELISTIRHRPKQSGLDITPQSFFSNFEYFELVEITHCKKNDEKDTSSVVALSRPKFKSVNLQTLRYGLYNRSKYATRWQDISIYYNTGELAGDTFACTVGDKYLAIYKKPTSNVISKKNDRYEKLPTVRFLKITNGKAVLSDIITYYMIDNTLTVAANDVMDWIDGTLVQK